MGNVQLDIVLVTVNVWNCTTPAECTGRYGTKTERSCDERGPLAETEREKVRALNKDTAQGLFSSITRDLSSVAHVWVKLFGG